MSNTKSKRKTVFIQRGFQTRFILWVIGLVVLCCLCSTGILYPLLSSELGAETTVAHRNIGGGGDRLVVAILIGNVLAIVIAGLATAVVILYISHKIAGPLYRFEHVCEEIGRGNLDVSATLRKADQLKGLSDAFVDMLDQLRNRSQDQKSRVDKARESANALRDVLPETGAGRELVESLDAQLASLTEEMTG
jgi:methyl-accepting chemotaxis protein